MEDNSDTPDPPERRVISIFTREIVEGDVLTTEAAERRANALEILDEIREDIESGAVIGFAIVVGVPNPERNGAITSISSVCSPEVDANAPVFLGGIERLKLRVLRGMDDDVEFGDDE